MGSWPGWPSSSTCCLDVTSTPTAPVHSNVVNGVSIPYAPAMADSAAGLTTLLSDGVAVREGLPERLSDMIQIRTISADLDETGPEPFLEFHALLADQFPLLHQHLTREVFDGLSLLFRWRGRRDAAPVVLMAHYDVVPVDPDDDWTHEPFAGAIVDGAVWGRGTLDDKGSLCALLEAVENLLAAGFVPERDVYVVAGGEEEVAGSGAKSIADALHARGLTPWLVLDEGGAIIDDALPAVDVPSAMVGVGEKGHLSVRIAASGDVGHASSPPAALSAIDRIARAVVRARQAPFPKRLNATTRTMFEFYRGRATGLGKVLTTVAPKVPPLSARLLALLGGEPAATVQTTVVTTTMNAGTVENMLAARASATMSLHIAVGETVDESFGRLKRGLRDPELTYEVLESREPSPESRTDSEQWQLICQAVEASYPGTLTVPYVSLGGTDSRHFHPYTPEATYRLAPLHMSAGQREGVHGVNEHVTIDALARGERFYRALITSLR